MSSVYMKLSQIFFKKSNGYTVVLDKTGTQSNTFTN